MNAQDRTQLLQTLRARFHQHPHLHPDVEWSAVQARLESRPAALAAVLAMEQTGGEPDVVRWPEPVDGHVFCDCAPESPAGRRSLCYDPEALDARKENKPAGSALGLAAEMGIQLLTEEQYRHLQGLGSVDQKTSSWILTPPDLRKLGGALFCDRRYGRVFTYHNGASSYYAARGFRGWVLV